MIGLLNVVYKHAVCVSIYIYKRKIYVGKHTYWKNYKGFLLGCQAFKRFSYSCSVNMLSVFVTQMQIVQLSSNYDAIIISSVNNKRLQLQWKRDGLPEGQIEKPCVPERQCSFIIHWCCTRNTSYSYCG